MKISYNPKSSQAAITPQTAANDDIIFDLYASKLWAKGIRIGADWADISSKPSSLKNPAAITFKDVNGKVISYDGSVATDLTAGTYIANRLATARKLWGQSFDGTKDINGSIVFPAIGDTATSSKISWSGSSDGADIYYQTTAKEQGNLVLNVKDDTNAYIQLALNGVFKSHFDVANSYWTGRSALADKWTTARTFTIGNTAKNVDGSGNVSWSLAEIGVRDTWRTVQVNGTSIGNNTLNLCGSTYIGLTNVNGKVTFSLVGSGTTANQAILSNGTANGWALKTLNIANWDAAYNFVSTITGTDADNVINKWEEIVNFLAGITEDNKLNTLLNSKLSIQQLSVKDILTTKTNNALFWVNTEGTASSITTGPFTDHPYALLSVTNYSAKNDNSNYFYRSRLAFSSVGDVRVASCHHGNRPEYTQDETWYDVLTSKNSGIDGSTIKLNGTSITVYSSGTADGRYVKKTGDIMTGALNFANNTWNNVGDDAAIGDCNQAGCIGIQNLTGSNPGLAFYKSSTLLSKLVGTANQFQRVSGNNVFNILDTSSTYISGNTITINGSSLTVSKSDHNHDGRYVKIWGSIDTDFNFPDSGDYSGVYACHASKTQSNKPLDYGLIANFSTSNGHLQFFGGSNNVIYTRSYWWTGQDNFKYTNWCTLLHSSNSFVKDGKGIINGTTITQVDNADKLDGYHANGLFTGLSNSGNSIKVDIGGTSKTLQVNYATNAGSASKVKVSQHTGNNVEYPLVWSNQASDKDTIENQLFKSWKDLYYNPKNKRLTVAGFINTAYINASNTVTSTGFVHSSVTKNANQYVLTADGGYAFFNQTSNELAHEFSKDITVTDEWTDIEDFYGGNQSFLTQPGTYIVQVYYNDSSADGMYEGYFSGIMSWFTGTTNSNNADEIVLHRVGHAYANTIYLRTRESLESETNPYTKLQISANTTLKQHTYKFKFKRIC